MRHQTRSFNKLKASFLSLFLLLTITATAQQPAFTGQPTDATVCEGSVASYSVTATNVNTYHWQIFDGTNWTNLSNTAPYSGVHTSSLSITSSSSLDGNTYRCFVYSVNTQYAISNQVSLNVDLLPSITSSPSQQTINTGGNAHYTVAATGTNLNFQWQENTGSGWTNLTNGGVYNNVTTTTLDITGAPISMNGNLYRCEVSGKCAPAVQSQSAILNIANPLSFNSHPSSVTICEGTTTNFSVSANNVNTYQWEYYNGTTWVKVPSTSPYSGVTSATLTITNAPASINGTQYHCRIYNPYAVSILSNDATITVETAPQITSQPVDQIASTNGNATYSVATTGSNLTYQWQVDAGSGWANLSNTGVYSGVTTNTLSLTTTPKAMDGDKYRCIVSGSCTPSVTSNAVDLTVTSPPSFVSHPTDVTVCDGGTVNYSVTADNANTYFWQYFDGSNWVTVNNGGIYSGATTATLTITGVTTSMSGYTFRCGIYNASTQYAASNTALLTVDALPSVTSNPADQSICINTSTTFGITATGKDITYQWQVDDGNGWTDLTNAGAYSNVTTKTLTVSNVTLAMDGYEYRCVVSGKCSPAANSASAELSIDLPPSITNQPVNASVCDGSDISFTVSATGASLTYQWQVDDGTGFVNVANNSTYAGAKTSTLTVTSSTSLDQYQYRCVISGKCSPSETSDAATITVDELPAITSQPTPAIICEGTNTSFTISATGTDIGYQWQVDDGSGFGDITDGTIYTGATTNTLNLTGVPYGMNMYQYRCVVSGKCSPDETSNAVDITVQLTTEVLTNITADTFCENATDFIPMSAQGVALSYKWQINNGSGYIDLASGGTYSGVNTDILGLTNIPASLDGQYIRCIVNGNCKSDTSKDIKAVVSFKPAVVAQPTNVTTIQGQDATFSIVSSGTAVTYQWQASSGSAFSNINDNAIYSGTRTSQLTITSTTEAQDNFTYRCIVMGVAECQFNNDTSSVAILNVNPPLSVSNTTANSQIALYPNPVSGNFVSVRSDLKKDLSYTIMDKVGKTLATGEITKDQQVNQVDVAHLPAGIYIITFSEDGNKIQTTRFTKL